MGQSIVDTAFLGTRNADERVRTAGFRSECAPTNPGAAATAPGFLVLRHPQVLAHFSRGSRRGQYPPAVTTAAAAAWRNRLGISGPDISHPERGRGVQSPGRQRYCSESLAQSLTLRPRAVGLPHHRHPITRDELLAGIVVGVICSAAIFYAIASWLR